MGLLILRYCIIGLTILLCIAIGIFRLVPPEEGLLMVIILVLIGVFFQNERQLSLLTELLQELQAKK